MDNINNGFNNVMEESFYILLDIYKPDFVVIVDKDAVETVVE